MTATIDAQTLEATPSPRKFLTALHEETFPTASQLGEEGVNALRAQLMNSKTRISAINNRRYLGNKHGITSFIRSVVEAECPGVATVVDIFSGTGAVANAFIDKTLVTNDLLYSNYLSGTAWFSPEDYRPEMIVRFVTFLNSLTTNEDNYVRRNFADTYFSAADCSKIGLARETVEQARRTHLINDREHAILVTSILYGMDRIANTVGHYDAYRKNMAFEKALDFPALFPQWDLPKDNQILNGDANEVIESLDCDLLYLDPPYNSRQYSDAYHLLENIARWEKPEVFGVARKMDRTSLKSDYNTVRASEALRELVAKANTRYIVFSYNNMANKGNGRSNAKISDDDIMEILNEKGEVQVFEKAHKAFSTGKSSIADNTERLFVCKVRPKHHVVKSIVLSPINYIGGKGKLIPQLQPLLPPAELFVDVFAGGCTVGANATADQVIFNDLNPQLIDLMRFLVDNDPADVIKAVDDKSVHYGLSDTFHSSYAAYDAQSSAGLAAYNKASYLHLRDDYNQARKSENKNLLLYLLIIFGFNNQLRFNGKGEFNLPVGKRDFNAKMRRKLELFNARINEIEHSFTSLDFREIDIDATPADTLFYCDPPYLITQATYNERGGWSTARERELLDFLDVVSRSGRKFALSNVTESKGRSNDILKDWIQSRDVVTHTLTMSYSNSNYQRLRDGSTTVEVLVTNY